MFDLVSYLFQDVCDFWILFRAWKNQSVEEKFETKLISTVVLGQNQICLRSIAVR